MSLGHPGIETLEAYAFGGLQVGARLVVGVHLNGCAACRGEVTRMEALAKQKFAQMEEDLKREIEQKGRETVIQAEREGWTRYHTNRAEFECRIGDLIERNESLTREIASLRERLAELMPDLLP